MNVSKLCNLQIVQNIEQTVCQLSKGTSYQQAKRQENEVKDERSISAKMSNMFKRFNKSKGPKCPIRPNETKCPKPFSSKTRAIEPAERTNV